MSLGGLLAALGSIIVVTVFYAALFGIVLLGYLIYRKFK